MFAGQILLLMLHPLGAGIVADPDVVAGPYLVEAGTCFVPGNVAGACFPGQLATGGGSP